MSSPVLPIFHLRRGAQHVEVFDPRADPRTLGARYVHGGYIAAWSVAGRCLTSGPSRYWNEFHGRGLPETFELPLGWALVNENETFLRIGAGQLRKRGVNVDDSSAKAALIATVDWTLVSHGDDHLTMSTLDGIEAGEFSVTYRLERTVRLHDDGVESITTLTLRGGRLSQHPLSWFAHPFFAQTKRSATAVTVPGAEFIMPTSHPPRWRNDAGTLQQQTDGRWRFAQEGASRSVLGNLWGSTTAVDIDLDPALGGGRVNMTLNRPLDHVVVWAAEHAFSPEPKLCRLWLDGETASWAVRYRFTPT